MPKQEWLMEEYWEELGYVTQREIKPIRAKIVDREYKKTKERIKKKTKELRNKRKDKL